jgi:hypothetical protein
MPSKEDCDTPLYWIFLGALGNTGRQLDMAELREAWKEWCDYRKRERMRPLTERAVRIQASYVRDDLPVTAQHIITAIERAMGSGWIMFRINKNDRYAGASKQVSQGQGQGLGAKGRVHRPGNHGKYRIPESGQ